MFTGRAQGVRTCENISLARAPSLPIASRSSCVPPSRAGLVNLHGSFSVVPVSMGLATGLLLFQRRSQAALWARREGRGHCSCPCLITLKFELA